MVENINTGNAGITTYYESMYSHVPVYFSTKDNATLAPKYIINNQDMKGICQCQVQYRIKLLVYNRMQVKQTNGSIIKRQSVFQTPFFSFIDNSMPNHRRHL